MVGPFAGVEAIGAGGIGSNIEMTLGVGVGSLSVKVGAGEIGIRPVLD